MVLTPTYHVFQMYTPFQEATYLPIDIATETKQVSKAYFKDSKDKGERPLPIVSATAAKTKSGSIVIALTNVSLDDDQDISIQLDGCQVKQVTGRILTSKRVDDYNDFEHPTKVAPQEFKKAKIKKNVLTVDLPAKSLVVLELTN